MLNYLSAFKSNICTRTVYHHPVELKDTLDIMSGNSFLGKREENWGL